MSQVGSIWEKDSLVCIINSTSFLLQEATRHHMLRKHVKLLQHAEELFYHIDHLVGCDFFLL